MKLMRICSCANTCCHLKISYFRNYELPYNYEFIFTKINFCCKFNFLTKFLYYENLEPYGKFRRFKTPLYNHHSPKPGHVPASWQQYIKNIVRVGIIKEPFVTHDTRTCISFAGKTILTYFCTNACFYFRSTHI